MIKKIIKSALGEKNVARIQRFKRSLNFVKDAYRQTDEEKLKCSCLVFVHMIEKGLVVGNTRYLDSLDYGGLIKKLTHLLETGTSPDDFAICESVAILKAVFTSLEGKAPFAKKLDQLITRYSIPCSFKGGAEVHTRSDLVKTYSNWHDFVSSRHSIRKFKDKIINQDVVYDIINDAKFCPSACNRQPCKIYFSENRETIDNILQNGADKFLIKGIHDAFIVTSDRSLFLPNELCEEYVNGGIFLGYLVLSIHAHGLGSCLFQFAQGNRRQDIIRAKFSIPKSEVIIAFVGFGELEEETVTACAQRKTTRSIAVNLDEQQD